MIQGRGWPQGEVASISKFDYLTSSQVFHHSKVFLGVPVLPQSVQGTKMSVQRQWYQLWAANRMIILEG